MAQRLILSCLESGIKERGKIQIVQVEEGYLHTAVLKTAALHLPDGLEIDLELPGVRD